MHEVGWWENALNKYAHFCTIVYLAARKGNSQNRGYHYTNNEARLVKIKATDKTGKSCWYNFNRNSL